ncbi:MAG: D-sedoheptulose 7-phosphate isomerase [Magnetococcus sp. DMHC-6]
MIDISATIRQHLAMVTSLDAQTPLIAQIAERMVQCIHKKGKILWMGNGGSAADCQHLAAELVGRFTRERKALPSIALTTDSSILTAIGNDYGYERIFQRQVAALCRPEDVVVGISTSGNSPNILHALNSAKQLGAWTVGFTGGEGGQLKLVADCCLIIPSPITARIQEGHILVGHILCDWIESAMMKMEKYV